MSIDPILSHVVAMSSELLWYTKCYDVLDHYEVCFLIFREACSKAWSAKMGFVHLCNGIDISRALR